MTISVKKFGGSSVSSVDKIKAIAEHIKEATLRDERVVVVVSAMGAHTDELMKKAKSISEHPSRRELDMLLSAGERVSMALLSMALHEINIDSLSLTGSQCGILTDGVHGNAKISKILGDRINVAVDQNKVVIVAGFQGVDPITKEITTLGRGGSDLTAVALASFLGAKHCSLYKDVPGIFSANPSKIKSARKIPELHYDEMMALSQAGAEVVQNRSVHLARKFRIPIHICLSAQPNEVGTIISGDVAMESPEVKAITTIKNLCQLQIKYRGHVSRGLALGDALKAAWQTGVKPIISRQASHKDMTIIDLFVPQEKSSEIVNNLDKQERNDKLTLESHRINEENLSSLSLVGSGFEMAPEMIENIGNYLDTPRVIAMQVSDHAITYVFDKIDLKFEAEELHDKLLK